jgi:hypothetical protein
LEWKIDTPVLDRFAVEKLFKIVLVCAIILVVTAFINFYAFILFSAVVFAVMVLLLISAMYVGHRQVLFRVDSQGAVFITPRTIRGANKIIGFMIMILGASQARLSAIMLGWSQASLPSSDWGGDKIDWDDVRSVELHPEKKVVILKEKWFTGGLGGGLRSFRIYCTSENYESVATGSLEKVEKRNVNGRKKRVT